MAQVKLRMANDFANTNVAEGLNCPRLTATNARNLVPKNRLVDRAISDFWIFPSVAILQNAIAHDQHGNPSGIQNPTQRGDGFPAKMFVCQNKASVLGGQPIFNGRFYDFHRQRAVVDPRVVQRVRFGEAIKNIYNRIQNRFASFLLR